MNRLKLVLLVAALALPVSSAQALEWVDYDGTIPDNAVSVNEGTEDRPVCRKNARIGIVNDSGKCYSVKVGGSISKKTQDDGYQILVDNSETEIQTAVADATEDMYTADEYAAATEGMYTEAEYDSNAGECTTTVKWMEYCTDAFKGGDCNLHDNTYPRSSEYVSSTIMIVNGVHFIASGGYHNSNYYVGFDRISSSRVSQPDVTCDADTGECSWTE
jgi:hypothetical protein